MNAMIIRPGPFGPVAIVWTASDRGPVVARVLISSPTRPGDRILRRDYPDAGAASCPAIDALADALRAMLRGAPGDVHLDLVALDSCPPFQQAVLRAARRIPRGQVRTYGEIAADLGKPGAARAVGNALANNPFPLVVPCHRVVRAGGHLGGYGGGSALKRALLALEGVAVDAAGRIAPPAAHRSIPARQSARPLAQSVSISRRSP